MNPLAKMKTHPNYKWVVVACCFLMVMISLGFCSSTGQLYLAAITNALGIKRSLYSISSSVRFISSAVLNFFFGTMVMRVGPRKMIALGFMSLICSMIIYSVAETVYIFYVGGFFLGVGLSSVGTTMVGYVVNQWVKEKKGTIMGAVMAANGIGGAISVQIVSPIIESEPFGYRNAYRVTALILLIVAVIVVTLFKDTPDGVERQAHGKKQAKGTAWEGIGFRGYLSKPFFYVTTVCVFFVGMLLTGSNGVYIAHMKDVGLKAEYVATVASVHSLALTVFKFLTGVSYDKFGLRVTMIITNIAAVVMMLLLAFVNNSPAGTVMAMIQGTISSLAMPMETVMLPLIAADMFGQKDYAKILGILVSINTFGYAVGSPLSNLFYDIHGTYKYGLIIMAAVMVAVSIGFQFVLIRAHRLRDQVQALESINNK